MAEIRVIGDLEVGGERGRVIYPLGMSTAITATEYKDPQKTIKRVDMVAEVITMPEQASKQAR